MAVKPGSNVALVTPMKENGDIDEQKLRSLLKWHIECKTDGIVALGTTGEVKGVEGLEGKISLLFSDGIISACQADGVLHG